MFSRNFMTVLTNFLAAISGACSSSKAESWCGLWHRWFDLQLPRRPCEDLQLLPREQTRRHRIWPFHPWNILGWSGPVPCSGLVRQTRFHSVPKQRAPASCQFSRRTIRSRIRRWLVFFWWLEARMGISGSVSPPKSLRAFPPSTRSCCPQLFVSG